eukprot:scaffold2236_cov136-Isochrysis_galbana.AAC.11
MHTNYASVTPPRNPRYARANKKDAYIPVKDFLSPPAAARMTLSMLKRTVFEMGLLNSGGVRNESWQVQKGIASGDRDR